MSTEHVTDLLPLYALGGLEVHELAQVEAHLLLCPQCRADSDELLAAAHALAASTPARAPRPAARAALLNRLPPRSRMPADTRTEPAAARLKAAPRRAVSWPMAALWAGLAALLGWNIYLTDRVNSLQQQYRAQAAAVALISSPITESLALRGQGTYVTASGRAYIDPDSRHVVLVVEHLQPLGASQNYQAWVITEHGPQSAGLVSVSRSGWGMAWLSVPYPEQATLGVSVEPAGGSEAPTEVVLMESEGG